MRAVMNDDAQILILTGATGCSKTLVAGQKFVDWILNAPADETQFYLIFKDMGTGARNIIDNNRLLFKNNKNYIIMVKGSANNATFQELKQDLINLLRKD